MSFRGLTIGSFVVGMAALIASFWTTGHTSEALNNTGAAFLGAGMFIGFAWFMSAMWKAL
jgi:hypothetical protein